MEEKTPNPPTQSFYGYQETPAPSARHRFWRRTVAAALFLLTLHQLYIWSPYPRNTGWIPCVLEGDSSETSKSVNSADLWGDIEPSAELKFTPCYNGFECARLQVPLDWNSTDTNDSLKANIAIIKKPALVDVADPRYGGPVMFNPGGPGGSGVLYTLTMGQALQTVVDSPSNEGASPEAALEEKYFDVLSFDPRGVNHTTPSAPGISDLGVRYEFEQKLADFGFAVDDEPSFNKIFGLYKLYGRLISSRENGNLRDGKHVGQFIGTAYVARDMVEIVERFGEWRSKSAKRILKIRCGSDIQCIQSLEDGNIDKSPFRSILERTAWRKGSERIQYWGFSYGTILGQTFASMYPERIGRFVLDGVANTSDYYAGAWKTSFLSSEDINANFTASCVKAGPVRCPMAKWTSEVASRNSNAAGLLSQFQNYLNALKINPVTDLFDHSQTPTMVTWSQAMQTLFTLYYNGWAGYRIASRMLYELSQGNPEWFHLTANRPFRCSSPDDSSPVDFPFAAALSIICIDAEDMTSITKEDWRTHITEIKNITPTFFGYGSLIPLPCLGYTQRPKWRYTEPLGAPAERLGNPILFVSQTLDPITPLVSAEGAAALFEGSGFVEAQGVGHCSFGWPNVCAMLEIRRYFATGEVRPGRLRCPATVSPFETEEQVLERMNRSSLDKGERKLLTKLVEVGRTWPRIDDGGY